MSNSKSLKMYNLNVNVATSLPVGFLGLEGQCNTPRTPEIVNSLVAMTNPFDALMKPIRENNSTGSDESRSGTVSPLGSPTSSPPSVQHTRSQLIKEGLKLTIQTKRKHSGSDTKEDTEDVDSKKMKREELTEEDEERRKRRRERNKIAATKCRMKKREKTANLVNESELLETQNVDLKTQIQDLQKQKRKLIDMLSMHASTCVKQSSPSSTNHVFEGFVEASEPYGNGFDGHPSFCSETPADFEVGSTKGTALNPYGKDPNFAKLIDDMSPPANFSRSFERSYAPSNVYSDSGAPTSFYQTKIKLNLDCNNKSSENRSCYEYQSEKKSVKDRLLLGRTLSKKVSASDEENSTEIFPPGFPCNQQDDVDSYKPNGIVDSNFFTNRTDVFPAGTDYVNAFGNNPLDNGCMA